MLPHSKIISALLLFAVVYRIPASRGQMRVSFDVIMEVALTLALAYGLWKYSKPVALFLVAATVSTFYPVYGPLSFYAQKMVFLGCLWFFLLMYFKPNIEDLAHVMCSATVLHIVVQCLQIIQQHLGFEYFFACGHPVGLMANPNETGALYAFCLPAFFIGEWRKVTKLSFFLPIAGIYLSSSKMGLVCSVVAFAVWLILNRRNAFKVAGAGIIAMVAYVLLFIPIHTLYLRAVVVLHTFPTLKQHWLMGCGLGHWQELFIGNMPVDGYWWNYAHNEFYQAWAEMGIAPIILIVWYFIEVIRRYRREVIVPFIALVVIAINSTGHFGWHIAPTAMIALAWMYIYQSKAIETAWATVQKTS